MITKEQIHQMIDDAPLSEIDTAMLSWVVMSFHYLPPLGIDEQLTAQPSDELYILDVDNVEGKLYLHELIEKKPFTDEELYTISVFIKYFYLLSPAALTEQPRFSSASSGFLNNLAALKKQGDYQQ